MSEYQFWHGDLRLFSAYAKAYIRDKAEKAYYQAQYTSLAVEIAVGNAFAKKRKDFADLVEYKEPFKEQKKDVEVTKDNLEEVFRAETLRQKQILKNILNKG